MLAAPCHACCAPCRGHVGEGAVGTASPGTGGGALGTGGTSGLWVGSSRSAPSPGVPAVFGSSGALPWFLSTAAQPRNRRQALSITPGWPRCRQHPPRGRDAPCQGILYVLPRAHTRDWECWDVVQEVWGLLVGSSHCWKPGGSLGSVWSSPRLTVAGVRCMALHAHGGLRFPC